MPKKNLTINNYYPPSPSSSRVSSESNRSNSSSSSCSPRASSYHLAGGYGYAAAPNSKPRSINAFSSKPYKSPDDMAKDTSGRQPVKTTLPNRPKPSWDQLAGSYTDSFASHGGYCGKPSGVVITYGGTCNDPPRGPDGTKWK